VMFLQTVRPVVSENPVIPLQTPHLRSEEGVGAVVSNVPGPHSVKVLQVVSVWLAAS
jgi:hypothetical protein